MYGNQVAQAKEREGQAIGQGIRTVGDAAVQYMAHREISTGAKVSSQIRLDLEQKLAAKIKDPNFDPDDPSTAGKFLEEDVNGALDTFKGGFLTDEGQKFAEQESDHIRSEMFTQTHAVFSHVAGNALVNNTKETSNNLAQAAFTNPAGAMGMMDTFDRLIHAKASSSPYLSAEDYARVMSDVGEGGKKQIAQAAVSGAIVNGGDWQAFVEKNPQLKPYISATETMQFQRTEQTYRRIADSEARSKVAQQREDVRISFNTAADNLELATLPQQAGQRPQLPSDYWDQVRKLGTMPGAAIEPGRLRTMVTTGEALTDRLNKTEPVTDPAVRDELTGRLFDPTNPTTVADVIKSQSSLSDGDMKRLTESVKMLQSEVFSGPEWKDTMDAVKGRLTYAMAGIPGKDPKGLENYARFVQTFIPQYLQQKNAGTLPPDALDVTNSKSMISKAMAPFKRSAAQLLHDRIDELSTLKDTEATPAPAQPPAPVRVLTPAAAVNLPVGTHYVTPDGREFVR